MKKLIYATMILLLASCTKVIEFDDNMTKPMLVAIADLEAGKPLNLTLSATMPVFGKESLNYTHDYEQGIHDSKAVVTAFIGNEKYILEPYRDSIYRNEHCPKAGDEVRFEVSYPGYTPVSGSTVIPEPIEAELVSRKIDRDNNMQTVRLRIHDKKGADYYRIQIYDIVEGEGFVYTYDNNWNITEQHLEHYRYAQSYWMQSDDPVFGVTDAASSVIDGLLGDESDVSGFFTDDLFDGDVYEVSVKSPQPWGSGEIEGPDEDGQWVRYTPYVSIQAVSRELYMYGASFWSYNANGDDGIFNDPTQIISNVKDGTGCIGAYSNKVIRLY